MYLDMYLDKNQQEKIGLIKKANKLNSVIVLRSVNKEEGKYEIEFDIKGCKRYLTVHNNRRLKTEERLKKDKFL